MNVEYIHYQVAAEQVEGFIAAFVAALGLLERDETVLACDLVRDSDDGGRFVVRVDWRSREAQKAYLQHEDYRTFMGLIAPFNAAFVSMRFHDPVHVGPRREPAG